MSKNSVSARHRATPGRSIVLEGLAVTAISQARVLGRPALVAVAVSGLVTGVGAPAQAGVYGADNQETTITGQAFTGAAAALPAENIHTVASGDTLGMIAAAYGVSLNDVLSTNGLSVSSIIFPGDQLRIPAAGYAAAAESATTSATSAAAPSQEISLTSDSAPVTAGSVGTHLLASANSQLGLQQDCTAMVEKALRSAGKRVGDLAPTQFFQYGTVVSTPAPGDLVITAGHVGIYAGNGQVVSGGVNGYTTAVHSLSWLPGASFVRVA